MWLFQYVLQFIAPFADILMIIGLFSSNPLKVLGFYLVFFLMDLLASLFAFKLEEENPKPLVWLILQRFIYRQFMTYVVIKSIFSSLRGVAVGWNKLKRLGVLNIPRNIRRHHKRADYLLFSLVLVS